MAAQWKKRLTEFLTINETLPDTDEGKKRVRKKAKNIIGQLGAGKDELSGIADILERHFAAICRQAASLFENKNEDQIYDYVDIHVRMLEKMYHKRLNGYAAIGYKAKGESMATESVNIIFDKSNFMPVYFNDIANASREILIVSPFVTKKRSLQMLQNLAVAIGNNVKVIVVTRPVEDFQDRDTVALQSTLDMLKGAGVRIVFKSKIHQKFAVIDQRVVWYGSINLLSFGSAEESIMRLESPNIANELIKSIER